MEDCRPVDSRLYCDRWRFTQWARAGLIWYSSGTVACPYCSTNWHSCLYLSSHFLVWTAPKRLARIFLPAECWLPPVVAECGWDNGGEGGEEESSPSLSSRCCGRDAEAEEVDERGAAASLLPLLISLSLFLFLGFGRLRSLDATSFWPSFGAGLLFLLWWWWWRCNPVRLLFCRCRCPRTWLDEVGAARRNAASVGDRSRAATAATLAEAAAENGPPPEVARCMDSAEWNGWLHGGNEMWSSRSSWKLSKAESPAMALSSVLQSLFPFPNGAEDLG
mmetsp:Transcript_2266/g.5891  ORF Transcript_2266/g.5891 Transcript_2266/m.5891 type:complete len:277 (-) Transcript_2266:808-1638(-)